MTRRVIMGTILTEVTGQTKETVSGVLEVFVDNFKAGGKIDEHLPEAEADQLLEELRQEKEGIRAWLIKGGLMMESRTGHA